MTYTLVWFLILNANCLIELKTASNIKYTKHVIIFKFKRLCYD
jgi:hypothetical protein